MRHLSSLFLPSFPADLAQVEVINTWRSSHIEYFCRQTIFQHFVFSFKYKSYFNRTPGTFSVSRHLLRYPYPILIDAPSSNTSYIRTTYTSMCGPQGHVPHGVDCKPFKASSLAANSLPEDCCFLLDVSGKWRQFESKDFETFCKTPGRTFHSENQCVEVKKKQKCKKGVNPSEVNEGLPCRLCDAWDSSGPAKFDLVKK